MESLKRIESLAPAHRSSMVGQAGVLKDLRELPKAEAIAWLRKLIHSPISQDWGRLLNALEADWGVLREWMRLDKEHALAAADAIHAQLETHASLPRGVTYSELKAELESVIALHQSPRLKKPLEALNAISKPITPSSEIAQVAQLLLGPSAGLFSPRVGTAPAQWHDIIHQSDGKHCVAVLDWRATESEQLEAISSLPIVAQSPAKSDLSVALLDLGSDEFIFVVLPAAQMQKLSELAPAGVSITASKLQPN